MNYKVIVKLVYLVQLMEIDQWQLNTNYNQMSQTNKIVLVDRMNIFGRKNFFFEKNDFSWKMTFREKWFFLKKWLFVKNDFSSAIKNLWLLRSAKLGVFGYNTICLPLYQFPSSITTIHTEGEKTTYVGFF